MTGLVRCTMQIINPHERRRGNDQTVIARTVLGNDILHSQSYWRRVYRTCGHAEDQYGKHREVSRRPTLGQIRMVEAAIRCDVACREAVQAWRNNA